MFALIDPVRNPNKPPGGHHGTDVLTDLRRLPWASIDNDDSLDLDQLSVAEQLPGGVVKIFVAVADVDAIVKKALLSMATRRPTPPRFIPPPKSFLCFRKSSRPTSRRLPTALIVPT
jgi:hypothetical protein